MGRRSLSGGVRPKGTNRIEFEFTYQGRRYRPTICRKPTPDNLRRACVRLAAIDQAIAEDTFDFWREFPRYRLRSRAPRPAADESPGKTCDEVFTAFLEHCEARVAMNDLSHSTLAGYRQILDHVWRPRIGEERFLEVRYSRLQEVLSGYVTKTEPSQKGHRRARGREPLSKKTYNSIASALRCAFEFGYRDHLDQHNPAARLKTLRMTPKDRKPIDPFTIQEAEAIIARSHATFGEAHGNYEEFRFFTALRPSEQFALTLADYDRANGTLSVQRARVGKHHKDRTKTNVDRQITLCPRAKAVLERQIALRERLARVGLCKHQFLFFEDDGAPLRDLSYPSKRWRDVLEGAQVRYRTPYTARHSFISWSLMSGKNLLELALEDGHSVHTMLSTYAAWIQGATAADVTMIKHAMEHAPDHSHVHLTTDPSRACRTRRLLRRDTVRARTLTWSRNRPPNRLASSQWQATHPAAALEDEPFLHNGSAHAEPGASREPGVRATRVASRVIRDA